MRRGVEALGLPAHDDWWQAGTGGIMIANHAATEIRERYRRCFVDGWYLTGDLAWRDADGCVAYLAARGARAG